MKFPQRMMILFSLFYHFIFIETIDVSPNHSLFTIAFVLCVGRQTATQMGQWISPSLWQLLYMYINWRNMILTSGSNGHRLLLRNLTWIRMAILLQMNLEWLVSCLFSVFLNIFCYKFSPQKLVIVLLQQYTQFIFASFIKVYFLRKGKGGV